MGFEGTESETRKQVADLLGRPLSDEEWEAFAQAQGQRPATGSSGSTTGKRGGGGHPTSFLARHAVSMLGIVIAAFIFGAGWAALLVGIGWAFGLAQSRVGIGSVGEFVTAAAALGVVIGLPMFSQPESSRAISWLIVGGVFLVGLVALAIGTIIRFA